MQNPVRLLCGLSFVSASSRHEIQRADQLVQVDYMPVVELDIRASKTDSSAWVARLDSSSTGREERELSYYEGLVVRPLLGPKCHIDELDRNETTTSELLGRHLPKSKIVKAFNAIQASQIESDGRPKGSSDRRALPIAGDDPTARLVSDLKGGSWRKAAVRQDRALILQLNSTTITRNHRRDEAQR
jgi:hypothetical protein